MSSTKQVISQNGIADPPSSVINLPISASSASRGVNSNLASIGSMVCRICQTNSGQEALISPCHCKGSMAYVHLSCLERWLNQASRSYCELCMFHFDAVQSRRYGLFEGMKLWFKHPRNRTHIQSDVLIGLLLTAITIGLIVVCFLGLKYFVVEAERIGVTKLWTEVILAIFICVVLIGYFVTIYLLVKDQVVPWYTWWKQTVDVRLLLSPSIAKGVRRQHSKDTAL